jgi:hypothetical protein
MAEVFTAVDEVESPHPIKINEDAARESPAAKCPSFVISFP